MIGIIPVVLLILFVWLVEISKYEKVSGKTSVGSLTFMT